MLDARIDQGRVVIEGPIPKEWEGQRVKILPLTPDDPTPDLEERLAVLHALGPMDIEPGEGELADQGLAEMNRLSRDAMKTLASSQP